MGLKNNITLLFALSIFAILYSCKKKEQIEVLSPKITHDTTPYVLENPHGFPALNIPEDNQLTVKGVELGRMLFYEKMLSGDNTMSCASCHLQENGFSDPNQFSEGIDGDFGGRNAPTIINAAWSAPFFWDGRAATLEEQALGPIENPIELHQSLEATVSKLQESDNYPQLFQLAFGSSEITSDYIAKAISQFERTIVSSNSKFDQFTQNNYTFTAEEAMGASIFNSEKGDCFHCHSGHLFTDNEFRNNGLDETFTDLGLSDISKDPLDDGKFKTPTLRNIEFSKPYMHDGRFAELEDVIDFYSDGLKISTTIDPLMKKAHQGGLQLTQPEKDALIAYLKCLSDSTYINNPSYSNPF